MPDSTKNTFAAALAHGAALVREENFGAPELASFVAGEQRDLVARRFHSRERVARRADVARE
jgi:hypothetical protein